MQQNGKTYYILDALEEFDLGAGRRFDINGTEIATFRVGEKVYAFSGLCPHEGASLAGGRVKDGCKIECPKHGWTFDMNDGSRVQDPETKICTYETIIHNGDVWVNVDEAKTRTE